MIVDKAKSPAMEGNIE